MQVPVRHLVTHSDSISKKLKPEKVLTLPTCPGSVPFSLLNGMPADQVDLESCHW